MVNPTWEIGVVRITCIVEQEALRQPQFGYRNLTTEMILGQDWLRTHFATEAGELRSNIQAFVVESQGPRIVVDTCAGNDKKQCPAGNADSIRPVIEAGLHELVEMDHRVTEEVRLEPTPGHTPGHVSVTITSAGARAVITGDLMHHPIQCALPHVYSKFDHDVAHARETRKAFLERYGDSDVRVIGTHFAAPTGGRLVKAGEGWHLSGES